MRRDIKINLLSIAISFIAGFIVATFFYYQSNKDLTKMNNMLLRTIKRKGDVEFSYDKDGNITDVFIGLSGKMEIKTSITGDLTTGMSPDNVK